MKKLEKIHVPAGCYKVYAEAYGSRLSNGARLIEEGAEDYDENTYSDYSDESDYE